ncbi:hypothetical protein [Streptomyces sp. NPDC050145]|uniref:hypothetical protein n=1 Tax=Streptomyces sp. NPDC050145 TaxID=3365602 RepID=UPI0037A3242F
MSNFIPESAGALCHRTPAKAGEAKGKVPTSANGWCLEKEANHASPAWTHSVAGAGLGLSVDVRIGDAETIMLHVGSNAGCWSARARDPRSSPGRGRVGEADEQERTG